MLNVTTTTIADKSADTVGNWSPFAGFIFVAFILFCVVLMALGSKK